MHSTSHHRPTSPRSGGFSLVELLVVMVIMAILVGLGIGLLGTAGTQARIAATQTTLKHIDALITQRTEAFRAAKLTKIVEEFELAYEAANSMQSFSAQDRKAAEILVRKNLFKQLFPMKVEDLYGMDGVPETADDPAIRKRVYPLPTMPVMEPAWTPAELLYLSMTEGTAYGLSPVTLDNIPASAIVPSPNDPTGKRMIFVDAFGTPIQLFRWPTGLMTAANLPVARALIPGLPATTNKDPDDPLRVLDKNVKFSGYAMPPATVINLEIGGSPVMANPFFEDDYHEPEAFHTPLLISGGPDRRVGVSGDHADSVNAADVTDDITNRQGR